MEGARTLPCTQSNLYAKIARLGLAGCGHMHHPTIRAGALVHVRGHMTPHRLLQGAAAGNFLENTIFGTHIYSDPPAPAAIGNKSLLLKILQRSQKTSRYSYHWEQPPTRPIRIAWTNQVHQAYPRQTNAFKRRSPWFPIPRFLIKDNVGRARTISPGYGNVKTACQYRQTGPISVGHHRSFRSRSAPKPRFFAEDNVWTVRRSPQDNTSAFPANALSRSFRITFFKNIGENLVSFYSKERNRIIISNVTDFKKLREFNLMICSCLMNGMSERQIGSIVGGNDKEYLLESSIQQTARW